MIIFPPLMPVASAFISFELHFVLLLANAVARVLLFFGSACASLAAFLLLSSRRFRISRISSLVNAVYGFSINKLSLLLSVHRVAGFSVHVPKRLRLLFCLFRIAVASPRFIDSIVRLVSRRLFSPFCRSRRVIVKNVHRRRRRSRRFSDQSVIREILPYQRQRQINKKFYTREIGRTNRGISSRTVCNKVNGMSFNRYVATVYTLCASFL